MTNETRKISIQVEELSTQQNKWQCISNKDLHKDGNLSFLPLTNTKVGRFQIVLFHSISNTASRVSLVICLSFSLTEMRVFVKNLDGDVISIEFERSDDIASVKAKIEEKTGIDPWHQRLIHVGHQVGGWMKVSDFDIQEGATIHIIHRGTLLRPSK